MLLEIAEQLRQKPGFRANTLATRMHIHERQVYAVAGSELVDVARRILGRDPDAAAMQAARAAATPPPAPATAATAPAPTSGGSGGSGGGGGSDRYQPPAGLSPAQSALLVALATQKFQDQPEANFVALMTQYERVVANRDDATIATLATSFRVTLSAPTASTSPSPTAAPTPATTATPSGRPTMVCPNQACVSSREDSSEEDSDEDDDHGVVPVYCGMCGTKLVEG